MSSKQDIQSVFDQARKATFKYLTGLYCANHLAHPRLAIILNKKYTKLAATRNLFRRIVRESFRLNKEKLKGLDIIVLIRSECSAHLHDKKALRDDIEQLWLILKKQ